MERSPHDMRFIVNVSAMEGKFYRFKKSTHPHTNMAKAALNMMTRLVGEERGGEEERGVGDGERDREGENYFIDFIDVINLITIINIKKIILIELLLKIIWILKFI